jgi:redox-sensitive bicupin YhaK (pirin superfamily)
VLNDDLVQGERGFGRHPHRDVEIVTYIVEGELTHQDSMGTRETLGRGSVQFMTAGTGIQHSEHNLNKQPLRFCQIWITPRAQGLTPEYGGYEGGSESALAARHNSLAHLVGDREQPHHSAPVRIMADCNLHVTELEASRSVSFGLDAGRQAYVVCLEGTATVSEEMGTGHEGGSECAAPLRLERHDAAELRGEGTLVLTSTGGGHEKAHVLLLEMAAGRGGRR